MALRNEKPSVINGNLNRALIQLQDTYNELAKSTDIESKRNNPFKENPFAEVDGIIGLMKEHEAKTKFLQAHK